MQPEKETRVGAGQTGRAHPPETDQLVWGSAVNTIWNSPVGWDWQKFREEGRWLVRPLYSGAHSSVSSEVLQHWHVLLTIPFPQLKVYTHQDKLHVVFCSLSKSSEKGTDCSHRLSRAEHNHGKQPPEAINVKGCSSSLSSVIVQLSAVFVIHALYAALLYCPRSGRNKPFRDKENLDLDLTMKLITEAEMILPYPNLTYKALMWSVIPDVLQSSHTSSLVWFDFKAQVEHIGSQCHQVLVFICDGMSWI